MEPFPCRWSLRLRPESQEVIFWDMFGITSGIGGHTKHTKMVYFFWYISLESQLIRENPHDDPIFEARAGPRIVS